MQTNYESSILGHLGLISGISKELGLVERIDKLLPCSSLDKIVSNGEGVLAMILNGLGFVNQRLYLTEHFFEDKPIDRLISPYIESKHLNDDCLGRVLDAIYDYGCSRFYDQVISDCFPKMGIDNHIGHMDITNFHLHGEYESQSRDGIQLVKGFSKDHRPDLVQASLLMITSQKGKIPLLMRPLDGNQEEGKAYKATILNHISGLQSNTNFDFCVIDSKGYNQNNISAIGEKTSISWLCRVPNSIGAVNEIIDCIEFEQLVKLNETYSYLSLCSTYGSVKQRWLVIHSNNLAKKQRHSIKKQSSKELEKKQAELKKLMQKTFACENDAQQALASFKKTLRFTQLNAIMKINKKRRYLKRGKPTKDTPFEMTFSIETQVEPNEEYIQKRLNKAGFFILATNELDQKKLADDQLLTEYKYQDGCEKGFRFMKDPMIMGSSLFLKKNERIEALLTVMTLCLFIYACLEYKIREKLDEHSEVFFKNQIGKPTRKPTAKWVFSCFKGIHLLKVNQENQIVLNLKPIQTKLLDLLGKQYWIYYS